MRKSDLEPLIERGLSTYKIAAEMGCSQVNVRYWLGKYELKTKRLPQDRCIPAKPMSASVVLPRPPEVDADRWDTNRLSARTESRILAALTQAGYVCYVPFGVVRADLVIETMEGLKAIQCKTATVRKSGVSLTFKTCSTDRQGRGTSYRGVVDYFATAAPGLPGVFLLPVDDVGVAEATLRLVPCVNNQVKGTRLAEHYLVPGSDIF